MGNATQPEYRRWAVPSQPAQTIRTVWGLGRDPVPFLDMTLVGDDSLLMDMDAPDIVPTGSTKRHEFQCDDGVIMVDSRVSYVLRDGERAC